MNNKSAEKATFVLGIISLILGGCAVLTKPEDLSRFVQAVPSVGTEESEVFDQMDQIDQMDLSDEPIAIDLAKSLERVALAHPVVMHAKWRVEEAQAKLQRAEALWLPSIQAGFNYHRHDGNYQAINGSIVDINSNSLQAGLGAGAIAAGTTARPGLVAQFHLADAIFLPEVATKKLWAQEYASNAVQNQQMLTAALGYIDLLDAYQDEALLRSSLQRLEELSKITGDYALVGSGLVSDAQRMNTELSLAKVRAQGAKERKLSASTRLARALSLPSFQVLIPEDATVVSWDLVDTSLPEKQEILDALHHRPELVESRELIAAAEAAYKREKSAPFVPSILLGYSTGGFGGGLGNDFGNWAGRYDIDALMTWELRNMGYGETAARNERHAQVRQSMLSTNIIMDQVAQQVSEARVQVTLRREQIETSKQAVQTASDCYEKNLERIREGQGLPIECLQAAQALEVCQRAYLKAISDYNRAQIQLLWAKGWHLQNCDFEDQGPGGS